ncbi:MAG: hypothetical protein ACI9ON_003179 [Limisphaerales bacterium]|jgi:hypothetical protein
MKDEYRLVYSGEVLDGQHTAVVKKRLAAVLKLDDERMTVLFSGKSVVVKKATDEKTAARYQAAFQKAGARLRVLPVDDGAPETPQPDPVETASDPSGADKSTASGLQVMPEGSLVIAEDERLEVVPVEVETDHLKVQGAVFITDDDELAVDVPNVDHITLAELGVLLGQERTDEAVIAEIDANFDLAEVGAVLGALANDKESGEIASVDSPDFDLAEPGELMDATPKAESPLPPDTSHIKLDDKEDDETA